jgi:hypothetical protein
LIINHREYLTSAVSSLCLSERETCSKLLVRSSWALADAFYKSNESIKELSIKVEAWQVIQNEGMTEESERHRPVGTD